MRLISCPYETVESKIRIRAWSAAFELRDTTPDTTFPRKRVVKTPNSEPNNCVQRIKNNLHVEYGLATSLDCSFCFVLIVCSANIQNWCDIPHTQSIYSPVNEYNSGLHYMKRGKNRNKNRNKRPKTNGKKPKWQKKSISVEQFE